MIQKGSLVKVLKKESYWFNKIGSVVIVDQSGIRYPIVVRFDSVNYLGTNTNNFNFDETISCKLPFSKMSVFGRYGENGAKKYEYTEFSKLNTFENDLP